MSIRLSVCLPSILFCRDSGTPSAAETVTRPTSGISIPSHRPWVGWKWSWHIPTSTHHLVTGWERSIRQFKARRQIHVRSLRP